MSIESEMEIPQEFRSGFPLGLPREKTLAEFYAPSPSQASEGKCVCVCVCVCVCLFVCLCM